MEQSLVMEQQQQALPFAEQYGSLANIQQGQGGLDLEQLGCLAAYYLLKQEQQTQKAHAAQKGVTSSLVFM